MLQRERGNEGRVPDFTYTVFFVFAKLVLLMSPWKQENLQVGVLFFEHISDRDKMHAILTT